MKYLIASIVSAFLGIIIAPHWCNALNWFVGAHERYRTILDLWKYFTYTFAYTSDSPFGFIMSCLVVAALCFIAMWPAILIMILSVIIYNKISKPPFK